MTTTLIQPALDEGPTFDPVTGPARGIMAEEAEKVRTLGLRMLRDHIRAPSDEPDEQDVEMFAALALAAHLRIDRLPEAMYAHEVLLAEAVRIVQRSGYGISDHYAELLVALIEYAGSAGWAYDDGQWRFMPARAEGAQ